MSTAYHSAGNSEAQQKQGLAAMLTQSTPGVAVTGVLTGLAVTQTATASGSVQIAQGSGVVGSSFTSGASLLTNPDPTLDVFTTNPVGSLPRNDIVVFDSVAKKVAVIIGTPNASPTDPTVPNTALKLWRLRHAANATTIVPAPADDLRVFTTLFGVPKQVSSTSILTGVAGWTVTTQEADRVGPLATLYILVRNDTGAAISPGAAGNIIDANVAKLVPAWWPSRQSPITWRGFDQAGPFGTGYIKADPSAEGGAGSVWIGDQNTGSSVAAGGSIEIFGTFPLAT